MYSGIAAYIYKSLPLTIVCLRRVLAHAGSSDFSQGPADWDRLLAMSLGPVHAAIARAQAALTRRQLGDAGLFARVSGVEQRALCDMLRPILGSLSDQAKSDLIHAVDGMPWSGADGSAIVELIATSSSGKGERKVRNPMQDFRSFIDCMTAEQWGTLLDARVSPAAKQELIIKVLCRLGCRHATEPTKKLACTLWHHVTGCQSADPVAKKKMRIKFGDLLRTAGLKLGAPVVYLAHLPTPQELAAQHPELHDAIFQEAPPVACQVDQVKLLEEDCAIMCRGGRSGTLELAQRLGPQTPTLQIGSDTDAPSNAALGQFGMMMLKSMEAMNATNSKVLELVLGGQGSLGALQPSNLHATPPPRQRRALTFDRAESLEALEDGSITGAAAEPQAVPGSASASSIGGTASAPSIATGGTAEALATSQPIGLAAAERRRRLVLAQQCVKKARSEQAASKPLEPPAPCAPRTPALKRSHVGSVITEMLTERTAEKEMLKKAQKADGKAEASAPTGKAKDKGLAQTPPKESFGAKLGKANGKGLKERALLQGLTDAKHGAGKASYSVERSRSQVLCRSGKKGDGSIPLQYGKGKIYPDEAAAVQAAKKWLKDQDM